MNQTPQRSRVPRLLLRGLSTIFIVLGVAAALYLITGLAVDVREFDETTGGYEYPFTGWTGTPIDYSGTYTTNDGLYKRGRVIELYFNCETGMVSYSLLGLIRGDWREFSDRAKVVHQPQVACRERGFDTSAWGFIDDPDNLYPDLAAPNNEA
jgi:hypothetical protein